MYLICLAASLVGGLMLSRLTKKLHLPAVTGQPKAITDHLRITLLPQAAAALGMALTTARRKNAI